VRSSVDEIAGNFLADLGLEAEEKGEDMDYLPVRTDGGGIARRQDAQIPDLSPYEGGRRLTPQQREIIERIREGALIQGGIDSLITEAKELSGKQRLETVIRLENEFHQMLLIRRLAEAQDEELGKLLGPAINREIHARANGIAALDDIAEELYLQNIERTYTEITHTPRKRQRFWGNVLGR
jgi:hypothetical protein